MPQISDHYQTLGVGEEAKPDEIKRAYRRLARQHHPDRNPGNSEAEEQFKAVQEAYDVLGDPAQRKAYDRARRNPFGSQGRPFPAGNGGAPFGAAGGSGFEGFYDISGQPDGAEAYDLGGLFSQFFGAEASRRTPRGRDVEVQVGLTFDQALRGGQTDVRLPDGEPFRLPIPPGVRSGMKLRLKGRGPAGPVGEPGDLYVTFRVEPSARFRREADDLHLSETVSAMEAILGTTRAITNAYGKTVKVQIPPGTQPGERLRLRGQGVATKSHTGDLYVEVLVSIPRHLTAEQRTGLERCARDLGIL